MRWRVEIRRSEGALKVKRQNVSRATSLDKNPDNAQSSPLQPIPINPLAPLTPGVYHIIPAPLYLVILSHAVHPIPRIYVRRDQASPATNRSQWSQDSPKAHFTLNLANGGL